jgi:hypothetical protein
MPSDRPAQFNRVVGLQLAGEERGHFPVIQALDGELQHRHLGRRGNGVAAFRAVAILGRQAYSGVLAREVAGPVAHRKPNGIPAIAKRHHKWGRWLLESGRCEDSIDGDAAPVSVELRPARHTVNIHRDLRRTKRTKLFPAPRHDLRTIVRFEREGPSVPWGVRSGPSGQHGKVPGQVLPGGSRFDSDWDRLP